MKKLLLIILIVVVVVGLYYYLTSFSVPRHIQVLKATCDLSIPQDAELVHFQDNDNTFGGDFYVEIILKLEDDSLAELINEAKEKGYKELPIKNLLGGFIYDNYSQSDKGLYKIDQDDYTEKTILINETRNQLVVQVINL
jgi:hypothetical protein